MKFLKPMKRLLLFLIFCCAALFSRATDRHLGSMVIAYGPSNKSTINAYYIYEISSSKSVLETGKMVESLKAETDELKYKRHVFYFNADEDAARRQFDLTLSKKEKKRFSNHKGGTVVWTGIIKPYPDVYSPQNVRPHITYSDNFRPGTPTAVDRNAGSSSRGTHMATCSSCGGSGEITYEKQSVSGGYKTYSTVDQYGRKTYSTSAGTGTTKCNVCNGTGKVMEED